MHKFDFLSGAPKTLIFQKDSNKTNMGGILTLIYLILALLIIITYIYDFFTSNKYTITYTYDYQTHEEEEFIKKRYYNESLNPKLNFSFKILNINNEEINASNFGLIYQIDFKNRKFYKFNENIQSSIYGFNFYIYYKCQNVIEGNCIIKPEDKLKDNMYYLIVNYSGFQLNHQNEESPITREYTTNKYILGKKEKISIYYLRWKTIIYSEEKSFTGIFGKKNDAKFGGEFLDPIIITSDEDDFYAVGELKKRGIKILSYIFIDVKEQQNYYDRYSRKGKNIFDSIASICSLCATIYDIFIFIFCGFYSNNFDNYKIIEKILLKAKNKKDNIIEYKINNRITDNYDINLNKENEKESARSSEINKDNTDKIKLSSFKNKNDILIDNTTVKNKIIIKEKENGTINKNKRILPKLHFWDYFFNNIYTKKCCFSKNQEIISTCNEIISKYYSIDCIVYNQLILENLFKDYKWNDEKLNNFLNNKLIKDLI